VDANGAGPRTITLWNGNVPDGTNPPANPVIAQATVNLVNGPQRVYLNFQVPSPGNYSLGAANANLYRNNAGASYPYTLPGVVSLTSSSSTTNPATFYYYFYDWRVRLDSCTGALSTVTATIVDANFSAVISGGTAAFTDNSTGATSWAWDFGDGNTSTQQNPTHTYTSNGPHLVTLTINNGVCSFSDSVAVSVGIEEINNAMNLVIVPNPADEETTLRFSQAFAQDLNIEVISIDGKVLLQTNMTAGESYKTLDVSQLPPAMYLVRLRSDAVVDVRKIVVAR
jgi:PKD repeat protein